MKYPAQLLRLASCVLLLGCVLLTTVSCGDDDPSNFLIGYYMDINSEVSLTLNDDDENQGTSPDKVVDVLSFTIRKMRAALLEAYPENTREGNDSAVLTELDKIYRSYHDNYGHLEGVTVCMVKLYRAHMRNGVVVDSTPLTTYRFGLLPSDIDPVGM